MINMMNDTEYTNIAVPYYGSIVRPGHGFENIYIFASTCNQTGQVTKTWIETWCGRTANDLGNWLALKNIDGLFSDGFSLALEKELNKADIWSRWDVSGDIHEIVQKHWQDLKAA